MSRFNGMMVKLLVLGHGCQGVIDLWHDAKVLGHDIMLLGHDVNPDGGG